jgi:hypothetical protein
MEEGPAVASIERRVGCGTDAEMDAAGDICTMPTDSAAVCAVNGSVDGTKFGPVFRCLGAVGAVTPAMVSATVGPPMGNKFAESCETCLAFVGVTGVIGVPLPLMVLAVLELATDVLPC